jgi:hypothetical protein
MDLKTFKDKIDQLGAHNNHLQVYITDPDGTDAPPIILANDIGIFESEGNLIVVIGDIPANFKPHQEKTNSAGVPVSLQKHDIPAEDVGRVVGNEPEKTTTVSGAPADKPQVDSTTNQMINSEGKTVEEQRSPLVTPNDPFAGLQEVK